MKQGLQVRLNQQLALTPQLQQAIRLLQMSTLELGTELRQLAEANPMLDLEDMGDDPGTGEREQPADQAAEQGDGDNANDDLAVSEPLEFEHGSSNGSGSFGSREPWQTIETAGSESLHEHLMWQLEVSSLPLQEKPLAAALIDALDDDGYLRSSNDDIRAALAGIDPPDDERIDNVRQRIMQFDPTGVASRNLKECLTAQLAFIDDHDQSIVTLAGRIIADGLDLLAHNDTEALARHLHVDAAQLPAAIALIHGLDPKPGHSFDSTPVEYVIPDAFAVKRHGLWQVTLNPDCEPRIEINQHYRALVGSSKGSEASYLRGCLQEARWLLKSLESRAQTIRKVATAIVEAQTGFMEFGPEAMRPLVLRDVAEAIDMHESTVSRVTTRKYLHTPRGIFEFKYFFSSRLATEAGGDASATAVQALIEKLVKNEDRSQPYSDEALVRALQQQGINVARRTVAKYRKTLRIPSSTQRRKKHA